MDECDDIDYRVIIEKVVKRVKRYTVSNYRERVGKQKNLMLD